MYEHQLTASKPRNPNYQPGQPDVRKLITVTPTRRFAQNFDIADRRYLSVKSNYRGFLGT